jgi:hypothetical protein
METIETINIREEYNKLKTENEWLREERHALRKVLQFYASFATNTLPYSNMVDYLIDNGKLAALALKESE